MTADNPSNRAVLPLLSALEALEARGLSRPSAASWSEYLAALSSLGILPLPLAERIGTEYHRRRFGGTTDDPSRLTGLLAELDEAIRAFEALDEPKRSALAASLREQFRPKDVSAKRFEPDPIFRPAPPTPNIAAAFSEPPVFDPHDDVAAASVRKSGWQKRTLIWSAASLAAVWTLGVLIGGYIAHDRIDRVISNVASSAGLDEPLDEIPDARRKVRENWPAAPPPRQKPTEMLFELATRHGNRGQDREAAYAYHLVLQLEPANALALNNLAWTLLTSKDKSLRDPVRALELAKNAVQADPNAVYLDTLAEAWFQNGDAEQAASFAERALDARGAAREMKHLQAQLKRFSNAIPKVPRPSDAAETATQGTTPVSAASAQSSTERTAVEAAKPSSPSPGRLEPAPPPK
jgi:hypothetical protein